MPEHGEAEAEAVLDRLVDLLGEATPSSTMRAPRSWQRLDARTM
jgi:hypothetical protein